MLLGQELSFSSITLARNGLKSNELTEFGAACSEGHRNGEQDRECVRSKNGVWLEHKLRAALT